MTAADPPNPAEPSHETLTRFGIAPEDEGAHPHDAEDATWNESIFYDFVQRDLGAAGHIRIGAMPGQGRVWLWIYVFDGERWLGLEEPRLPIAEFDWDRFGYEGPGLSFSREVVRPLLENRVHAKAFARVLSGPGVGRIEPVELDLVVFGVGPCHGVGDTGTPGHSHEELRAARFEQPTLVRGTLRVGGREIPLDASGERDHSWGPRFWNMAWHFLVLARGQTRLQVAAVTFDPNSEDEDDLLFVGYLHAPGGDERVTVELDEARFTLDYDDGSPLAPYAGRIEAQFEDGHGLRGRIEAIGGTELDASHTFTPPQPSIYRRALVRFFPDDDGEPFVGWLEVNRFPNGMLEEAG